MIKNNADAPRRWYFSIGDPPGPFSKIIFYGKNIEIFRKSSRNITVNASRRYFPCDSDRHHSYSAEYLFYYGEPSALPEYAADDDVANLQRSGDAGGADMPKSSGQTAAAALLAPTGRIAHRLRHSLNLFGDRGTRYDADPCACDSKRLLVCHP